jgi:hypothetical protein
MAFGVEGRHVGRMKSFLVVRAPPTTPLRHNRLKMPPMRQTLRTALIADQKTQY